RQLGVYELTVAKGGPKLQAAKDGCVIPDPSQRGMGLSPQPGQPPAIPCGRVFATIGSVSFLRGGKAEISALASTLSSLLGRTVIDKTGLRGTFDINVTFLNDDSLSMRPPP